MADWISATALMLRSSFSARRRFLRTGKIERQPAPHVGVDVGLAMLDFGGVDQLAVDPVAADGLHVVGVGLDAQGGRGVAAPVRGRGHLAGLDEPQPGRAVGGGKKPQKALAVAVLAADDLLLPLVPLVDADELVQHGLDLGQHGVARRAAWLGQHAVAVAAADDVTDAVFMAVDGEGVAGGQRPALAA